MLCAQAERNACRLHELLEPVKVIGAQMSDRQGEDTKLLNQQKRQQKTCTIPLKIAALVAVVALLFGFIAIVLSGVNRTEIENLNNKIDDLETYLNLSLQRQIEDLYDKMTSELSGIESSLNALTTRVNTPVNLYQKCIRQTRTCNVLTTAACITQPLPINTTVSSLKHHVSFCNCIQRSF